MLPDLHFISLKGVSIFEQLQLEEALLRTDERSFCIVNFGSPPAIVMGISGQPHLLLDLLKVRDHNVPVIQRFSGGGTVIIDEETLFVTFIMAREHLAFPPYPEPILRWSADLYSSAWAIPDFQLRENDYCIGHKKCGGNAQYIRKARWVHHTSFLWNYQPKNMEMLLLPPKRPVYRQDRPHEAFLCRLQSFGSDLNARIRQLRTKLLQQFHLRDFDLSSLEKKAHRQTTASVALNSLP